VRFKDSQTGAAALETALVLPVLIALLLGVVQLTLLAHAKLMTEYAAFCAARAGIVWSGSNERMRNAALLALLPTQGRTDDLQNLGESLLHQEWTDRNFRRLPWGGEVPSEVNGAPLNGLVRVDVLHPTGGSFDAVARESGSSRALEEVDFDRVEQSATRRAGVLKVRVRYWYELRVPLANWLIFVSWYATNAAVRVTGALHESQLASGGGAPGIAHRDGYPTATGSEMAVLWKLATGHLIVPGLATRRFFLPVTASYSLSMQSNFYRKWLMHSASAGDE